jgi:hypothetical protein
MIELDHLELLDRDELLTVVTNLLQGGMVLNFHGKLSERR